MDNENLLKTLLLKQEKLLKYNKKIFKFCCIFSVIFLFVYLYKVPEVGGDNSRLQRKINEIVGKIRVENAIFADKEKIKKDNIELKNIFSEITEKKLNQFPVSIYLSQISKLAKKSKIEIESFLPEEKEEGKEKSKKEDKEENNDFSITKVNVSIVGNFHNILSFWSEISNLKNILLIKEFKLSDSFRENNEMKVKGNFAINIYEIRNNKKEKGSI